MIKTLLLFILLANAYAYNEVANGDRIREGLSVATLLTGDLSQVKVAILDNGFKGFIPHKGMLPASAEFVEGPLKLPEMSSHGLGMAQILWEATGKTDQGPKFYLINSNGFTNFKAAVDFVVNNKIDIVLYAQVWTFGSNFDGKGFINEVVNRAINAGVIWINAAGNLGGHVYNGNVKALAEDIRIVNKLDDNNFTLTLTWNDFNNNEQVCSLKNLDLSIYDSHGRLVRSSEFIQNGSGPDPKDPKDKRSCYARETINLNSLERGTYSVKVVAKSSNFKNSDAFRLLITENKPGSLEFTSSKSGFEIMPPADNPQVLTVGERTQFSAMGPTADGRVKPDVLVGDAVVAFTNGSQTAGSSNAAAMVAGAVTLMKAKDVSLTGKELLDYSVKLRSRFVIHGHLVKLPVVPEWVKPLVPKAGSVRQDPGTYRIVILSKESPVDLPQLRRFNLKTYRKDDIVACTETMNYCGVFPGEQDLSIKPPYIEFKQYKEGPVGDGPALWTTPI